MRPLSPGEREIMESMVEDCSLQSVLDTLASICIDKSGEILGNDASKLLAIAMQKRKTDSLRWESIGLKLNKLRQIAENKGI